MLRKLTLITLIILSLLVIASCDRFDKPTINEVIDYNEIVTTVFDDFSSTATVTTSDNISDFMTYFDDDYLNDGQTKEDIEDIVSGVFLVNEPRFINVELLSNNELLVSWNLIISTTDNQVVETMTFADQLRQVGSVYYLYGNQQEATNENKLRPFAEIMTATWCGTCPEVEEDIHNYQYSNPDNFFYLEFHTQDAISGEHEFFDNFYGYTSPPVAILQGKDVFSGDQGDIFPSILDAYKEMDAQFMLSNLVETTNTETYQVHLDIDKITTEVVDLTNLKLRWAFYEEVSAANNYAGNPCRNVVLTEGYYDIMESDINSTYAINIDYPRDIPDDLGVVFWLQTAGETYGDDSFVHAWIKEEVRSK